MFRNVKTSAAPLPGLSEALVEYAMTPGSTVTGTA